MSIQDEHPRGRTELECTLCGHYPVDRKDDDLVVCPQCHESYSLIRHDKFTMMALDGWITQVTVEPVDEIVPTEAG